MSELKVDPSNTTIEIDPRSLDKAELSYDICLNGTDTTTEVSAQHPQIENKRKNKKKRINKKWTKKYGTFISFHDWWVTSKRPISNDFWYINATSPSILNKEWFSN